MASLFPKRKRITSRDRKLSQYFLPTRRTLIYLGAVLLLISMLLNIFLFLRVRDCRETILALEQELADTREPSDASSEVLGHWYGLCPKNSIHSIEDFHLMVDNDPLLADHFANFDWENARMGNHEKEIWTHVTYRKDEKIRMTSKPLRLPRGDGYITDGKRWVRKYCGNDYVLAGSQEQTDDKEDKHKKPKKPEVMPEPNTFLLVATGIAGLFLAGFARKRIV